MSYRTDFRAVSYPLRLYSGKDALENLPAELKRHRSQRAFIVCGRTVSRKTPLIARMRTILGDSVAGVFDEMAKESPLSAVLAARDAARDARADLLIGVGAGSVIQATRVVAILLAETRPVEELITQYPETGPAISPKLARTEASDHQRADGRHVRAEPRRLRGQRRERRSSHGVLRSEDAPGRDLLGQRCAPYRAAIACTHDGRLDLLACADEHGRDSTCPRSSKAIACTRCGLRATQCLDWRM